MTLWIIYYFIGIYLTIINYLFLPKKYDKESTMLSIHIIFTVPSAYYLAEKTIHNWSLPDNIFISLFLTSILIFLSLFLWGIVVKRITRIQRSNHSLNSEKTS